MEKQERKLYISASVADGLPAMVRNELSKLSPEKQEEFVEEYKRKAKSVGLVYLCWFFSIQYAYLGQWGLLILYWLTCGGFFIWALIDLFRLAGAVKNHNKDVSTDVMRSLKMMSS